RLTYEKDTEPYSLYRDAEVEKLLAGTNCEIRSFTSHTLFDLDVLLRPPKTEHEKKVWKKGVPPLTYRSFISEALGKKSNGDKVSLPIPAPEEIPCSFVDLDKLKKRLFELGLDSEIAGPNGDFEVPCAKELNLKFPSDKEGSPH
ncbi:hypothetical protein L0F63_005666, partial [Massospora cicadina]